MLIKWKPGLTIFLVLVIGSSLSGMGAYFLYRDNVSKHKVEVEKEFVDFKSQVLTLALIKSAGQHVSLRSR